MRRHDRSRVPTRLTADYDPARTTFDWIHKLLKRARELGMQDAVAYHLVGASLQVGLSHGEVTRRAYSTADDQLDRPGDFCIEDTAFHVTVAPMPGVYERCRKNLIEGYRVFLLVPDQSVVGARQNAEVVAPGRIAVLSIEAFVAQNIEELSAFSRDRLALGFRCLLETYNDRVERSELDKSMLVEIPRNLLVTRHPSQARGN
jgi:hypothetical protein